MRNIFLVARRDYLGYVTAWGFWVGLLLTPVLLGVGMMAPTLAASTAPTRHYAVIETGTAFSDALNAEFESQRAETVRLQLSAGAASLDNIADVQARFDEAVENGASPEEAMAAAGISGAIPLPSQTFVQVAPPATSIDDLRAYLMGERLVSTPDGPQPLFAAIIVPDTGGPVQYWSENVTVGGLKAAVNRAARLIARDNVLSEAGIDAGILTEIEAATRPIEERRARPASSQADSAVTMADRAPFVAAIAIAFMLWTLIFSVVNYLLMGTIEERSNKIFDTLLTSVRLPELLAGKLIAVLAVAMTLMTFWMLGGAVMSLAVAGALPPDALDMVGTIAAAALKPSIVIPALLSFVLGYLMYGSIFLALGSLCDTIQEAQTLMSPLLVLLMVPLFMLIVAIDDPSSPVLQVMSWIPLFTPFLLILRMPTEPPLLEVVGQLGLMAAFALLILFLAARVYRAGAVHGAGVSDVAAWFRRLLPGGSKKTATAP